MTESREAAQASLLELPVKRPLRSVLKQSSVDSNSPQNRSVTKTNSRVSIGHVDIEEVRVFTEEKDVSHKTLNPEHYEEHLLIRVSRTAGYGPPTVVRTSSGFHATWGTEEKLTYMKFSDAITQAMEQLAEEQRLEEESRRLKFDLTHAAACLTEPRLLMREGSFKISSISCGHEETDANDDAEFNPADGALVVVHADLRKYQAPSDVCVACCATQ